MSWIREINQDYLETIKLLNERIIYLNDQRVGVAKFYFTVLGALLVFLGAIFTSIPYFINFFGFVIILLFLLITGVGAFIYDIMIRARAAAAARGIRDRLTKKSNDPYSYCIGKFCNKYTFFCYGKKLLGMPEDFFFCFSIALINGYILAALILISALQIIFGTFYDYMLSIYFLLIFLLLGFFFFFIEVIIWRRMSNCLHNIMDEWPV